MLFNKPEIKLTTTATTIISLKSHILAKSRNFRSQKSKVKECWRTLSLGNFRKFVAKITHFRHISAKIQPKNLKVVLLVLSSARQHIDLGM